MVDEIDIPLGKLTDSETRMRLIMDFGKAIGLEHDDIITVMFLALGDVNDVSPLNSILKKVRLPKAKSKYNREKMFSLASMLADRMKELDQYGILTVNPEQVLKRTRNGEYITVFGMETTPLVYHNVWRMLSVKQEYMADTLLGIKEALDLLIKFLQIEQI